MPPGTGPARRQSGMKAYSSTTNGYRVSKTSMETWNALPNAWPPRELEPVLCRPRAPGRRVGAKVPRVILPVASSPPERCGLGRRVRRDDLLRDHPGQRGAQRVDRCVATSRCCRSPQAEPRVSPPTLPRDDRNRPIAAVVLRHRRVGEVEQGAIGRRINHPEHAVGRPFDLWVRAAKSTVISLPSTVTRA